MRDYRIIGENIAQTGFFSEYLPPCFQLNIDVFKCPAPANCDVVAPYTFTMSRFNGNDARRIISLPEIGAYIAAHNYINEKNLIKDLIEFAEQSNASFSPILGQDDSIIRHEQAYENHPEMGQPIPTQYIENIEKKLIRAAGARQILKLDISNCFSSFYMHMIPAIFLGVEIAEQEYRKNQKRGEETASEQYKKYSKLDVAIRKQNLNRTNGLLVGPLLSKIIVEAILTRIDLELEAVGIHFSRYVDDYEVYLYRHEEKEIISVFEKILKQYGFFLNSEKTELIDFPYYVEENFEKLLDSRLRDNMNQQELMELFNTFFLMEKNGVKGAIRYILKAIESRTVTIECPLFKAYLLSIIANNGRSLSKACSLLIVNKDKLPLEEKDIEIITSMLSYQIVCKHDLEVIWLLYLLIQTTHIKKDDQIVEKLVDSDNELAQVMLLRKDLLSEKLIDQIRSKANSWILLYELYSEAYIDEEMFVDKLGIEKNIDMYRSFRHRKIHFCTI